MYPKIARHLFYPLLDLKRGSKALKYLKELEKSQWFNSKKLYNFQIKKLRLLVYHVYNNVPYYHKIFRKLNLKPTEIKSNEDLLKLPILTKELIRTNYSDLIAKNIPKNRYYKSSTGGSTGKPLQFLQDKVSTDYGSAATYRAWSWTGWKVGDKYVNLWGASKDIAREKRFRTKLRQALLRDNLLLSSYDMTKSNLDVYVSRIKAFNPKFIRGYASAIYLLAKYLKENEIEDINPEAVITTSENLFGYQREMIEQQLNCKIFDEYGAREHSMIAFECQMHMGYHITIENLCLECVKNNEHVSYGELGEIFTTDLNNYSMPFIRYEIGDLGTPTDEHCECGRGLPKLKSIDGRTTDLIQTPSGRYIAGPGLTLLYKDLENLKQIQLIQNSLDKLKVKIVKGSNYSEKDTKKLMTALHKYIGRDIEIELEFVDTIPPEPSGKQRLVISKVKIDF